MKRYIGRHVYTTTIFGGCLYGLSALFYGSRSIVLSRDRHLGLNKMLTVISLSLVFGAVDLWNFDCNISNQVIEDIIENRL